MKKTYPLVTDKVDDKFVSSSEQDDPFPIVEGARPKSIVPKLNAPSYHPMRRNFCSQYRMLLKGPVVHSQKNVMKSGFNDLDTDAPYEIDISGTAINRMMYADDTILISVKVGLSLNSNKSGLSSIIEGNEKGLMYVDPSHILTSSDGTIKNMELNDLLQVFSSRSYCDFKSWLKVLVFHVFILSVMKSRDHEYEDDDDGGEDVEEKEEVLSSCTTCNGYYYGPSFGEPVCATCHAFLYADDLDPEGVRDLSSEAGGEDRDSGNEEPNDDFPAHDTNNNTNRNNININHSLNNSNGGAVVYGFSPRVEALNQVRLGDGGPLDELPPEWGNVSHRWNSLLSRISSEKWQVYTQRRWPLFVPFASIQDWYAVYSALIESSYCLTCIYQMTEVIPADNNSLPLRWKRLGHDLRNFSQDPLEGIRAQPLDSSYYHWQASITGPVGSPYEGGIFFLIFHPNISRHGDVGIDLIQENNWSSSLTIPKVLISIQSLLTDPYCDICMEPRIGSLYRTDRKKF
ncbi:unnamed protein product [Lepeophtheirus salmonis]|uniref:(salmon louse) hypothetical protein n=1 Tax=Lepeophtheirus salmonis TaxID=72036 RepID=A0A7R8D0E6_LEPSM|nr:unnamed protein product [Lepeophtheirus salmonis]CAF2983402.1 unnamed protein product [Lepeophtheirus salmonis]